MNGVSNSNQVCSRALALNILGLKPYYEPLGLKLKALNILGLKPYYEPLGLKPYYKRNK